MTLITIPTPKLKRRIDRSLGALAVLIRFTELANLATRGRFFAEGWV